MRVEITIILLNFLICESSVLNSFLSHRYHGFHRFLPCAGWGKVMQISLITQIGISSVSVWGGTSGKGGKILVLSNLKQASFEVGLSLT